MGFIDILKAILLGTVQGLTEFLPVSSSGHLTLLQRLLRLDLSGASMTFVNVMLHIGTLLPVLWIFRKDILALFQKPFRTLLMLIVATIPAGVVGLLFNDKIDALFAGSKGWKALSICFLFTAFLMLLSEYFALKLKKRPFGWRQSLPMGFVQAIALFPGISRSGSTIAAGTIAGGKGEEIAKFSFLMSVPVILGSAAVECKDVFFSGGTGLTPSGGLAILFGMIFAAISGFFAIKLMLKVIKKANYKWFSLYLVLLSFLCIWLDVLNLF